MLHKSVRWSLSLLTLCCVLINGCAGKKAAGNDTPPPPLKGITWTLESAGTDDATESVPDGVTITLQISRDNSVAGGAGCNNYRNTCTVNGQSIRFSPIAMTKKMCPDKPEAMRWEQRYVAALGACTTYALEDSTLLLRGPGGHELRFRPASE